MTRREYTGLLDVERILVATRDRAADHRYDANGYMVSDSIQRHIFLWEGLSDSASRANLARFVYLAHVYAPRRTPKLLAYMSSNDARLVAYTTIDVERVLVLRQAQLALGLREGEGIR